MRALAAAIEALDRPVDLFFRDDDAAWADAELFALIDLFEARELAIDLAVIPAALGPQTAGELTSRRSRNPKLGLHQHGYAHVNYEPPDNRKCEFGAARSYERQMADVIAGRERLTGMLGGTDPIFTPPWNRCSTELESGLAMHGFALLSADRSRKSANGIAHLPVSLDWERARREDRLDAAVAEQFDTSKGPVGIMLHHAAMDADARDELAGALDLIRDSDTIAVRPMRHWITEQDDA